MGIWKAKSVRAKVFLGSLSSLVVDHVPDCSDRTNVVELIAVTKAGEQRSINSERWIDEVLSVELSKHLF